jgi:hypothetical protein
MPGEVQVEMGAVRISMSSGTHAEISEVLDYALPLTGRRRSWNYRHILG